MNKTIDIIILTGPTGVGKTNLSLEIAKKFNTDIISADSMQVYKGMNIGTDKIMPEQMADIKHYNIDVTTPDKVYSVKEYANRTKSIIEKLDKESKVPFIVGGSGLYIDSIIYDLGFGKKSDPIIRKNLELELKKFGLKRLVTRLKEIDLDYANSIDCQNPRRVIRALEIYEITKNKPSKYLNKKNLRYKNLKYNYRYFVLNREREKLYENINNRVDMMIEDGLIDEVKALYDKYNTKDSALFTAIGYKEIISYLNGEIDKADAIMLIKKNSRNYAKRQLTWFRREKEAIWIDKENKTNSEIIDEIMEKIY